MANAALRGVNACAAKVFLRHVLARHGFHHLRTGEEHVAHAFEHHHEVREGRGVYRAAGTRAADAGYLGHHAAGLDVALEDVAETGEGVDAFLYACAARVVKTDAGHAHLHALVHHFADFLCHRFGERAAVYSEILCKHIDEAAVDCAATGYHAIAEELLLLHAEIVTAVKFEHVHFLKRAFVEQHVDALACGGLAFFVLLLNRFFPAAEACLLAEFHELLDFL